MFKMLDIDQDGYLDANDIDDAWELADKISDFGQEINKLVQYYVSVNLKNKGGMLQKEKINMFMYKQIITQGHGHQPPKQHEELELNSDGEIADEEAQNNFVHFKSCCIDEIKKKVMAGKETFKDFSVFIASKEQLKKEKERMA